MSEDLDSAFNSLVQSVKGDIEEGVSVALKESIDLFSGDGGFPLNYDAVRDLGSFLPSIEPYPEYESPVLQDSYPDLKYNPPFSCLRNDSGVLITFGKVFFYNEDNKSYEVVSPTHEINSDGTLIGGTDYNELKEFSIASGDTVYVVINPTKDGTNRARLAAGSNVGTLNLADDDSAIPIFKDTSNTIGTETDDTGLELWSGNIFFAQGGGGDSSFPFKVSISYTETHQVQFAVAEGLIFNSDFSTGSDIHTLKIEDPEDVAAGVNDVRYVWIKQTVDGSGVSTFTLESGDEPTEFITQATTGDPPESQYYASETKHLIAKLEIDTASDLDNKPVTITQYTTTNLVRVTSTHSGVVYYRLLPR